MFKYIRNRIFNRQYVSIDNGVEGVEGVKESKESKLLM